MSDKTEALQALVDRYQEYQVWLADGNKVDDPSNDEDRADWLYDIADYVGEFVDTLPGMTRQLVEGIKA